MISVAKTFEWDMGHRVTNHASLCKNPHGHRYKMILAVNGVLHTEKNSSDEDMIVDFGTLKQVVNDTIVKKLDHSFMFWEDDPVMAPFAESNPNLLMYAMPFIPTAERIAEYISHQLAEILPKEIPGIILESVTVFETPTSQAIWRP